MKYAALVAQEEDALWNSKVIGDDNLLALQRADFLCRQDVLSERWRGAV